MEKLSKLVSEYIIKPALGVGLIVSLTGCSNSNQQGVFQTDGFNRAEHFEGAIRQAYNRNGGILKWGNDHDFDSDHLNDWYVIAKDSTTYHTKSRRLYDGLDYPSIRTWFKIPQNLEEEYKTVVED